MLEELKSAIIKGRINITDHADEELAYDEILDEDLFHSVLYGEVIEDYANDKPFPVVSCMAEIKKEDIYTASGHIRMNTTLQSP